MVTVTTTGRHFRRYEIVFPDLYSVKRIWDSGIGKLTFEFWRALDLHKLGGHLRSGKQHYVRCNASKIKVEKRSPIQSIILTL